MLTFVTLIDLSRDAADAYEASRNDRRVLADLDYLPDKAKAVLNVGNRSFIAGDAVAAVKRHINRLNLQIEGSPATLGRWNTELFGEAGEPSW